MIAVPDIGTGTTPHRGLVEAELLTGIVLTIER
jgi:hypothetical protein